MMRFEWYEAEPIIGELLYRPIEYSIDFDPESRASLDERMGSEGVTSIMFATLQIEVAVESGELLYPWGLFPNTRWRNGPLQPPRFVTGRVRVLTDNKLQPGVSLLFPTGESWPSLRDNTSGWICVGDPTPRSEAIAIEYATNAAVVLIGSQLVSLWLRPRL